MGLWKDLLRRLGLTTDARVHISAPGVEVTITGNPGQVRHLLGVVKYELERSLRWQERGQSRALPDAAPKRPSQPPPSSGRSGQFVQPTELDEMDSPYAFGARVVPVEEVTASGEESTGEPEAISRFTSEPTTLVPDSRASFDELAAAEQSFDSVEPGRDRDVTAVAIRKDMVSGDRRNGGGEADLRALALLVRNASEPDGDDATREVTRDT